MENKLCIGDVIGKINSIGPSLKLYNWMIPGKLKNKLLSSFNSGLHS